MVNFNGDLLPDSAHFLNHDNRGLRYGDALSECARYTGQSVLFSEDHYFRLMACMRQLRMEIPMDFTLEHLESEILKTLVASGLQGSPALIEILVMRRGGGPLLPETRDVLYTIAATPMEEVTFKLGRTPFLADLFKDYYLPSDALGRLPHTNRLRQVLAGIFASENALDTCILLNDRKEVVEGLEGNLFLRKGSRIKTPPLESGCKAGVLRGFLLKQGMPGDSYELVEDTVSPFELQQADELFTMDIVHGVQPISQYRKAKYSTEAASYVTEVLNEMIPAGS